MLFHSESSQIKVQTCVCGVLGGLRKLKDPHVKCGPNPKGVWGRDGWGGWRGWSHLGNRRHLSQQTNNVSRRWKVAAAAATVLLSMSGCERWGWGFALRQSGIVLINE